MSFFGGVASGDSNAQPCWRTAFPDLILQSGKLRPERRQGLQIGGRTRRETCSS